MKYLLLSLAMAITALFPKESFADEPRKIELFCDSWRCCDCENYTPKSLLMKFEHRLTVDKIIIKNPNILSDIGKYIANLSQNKAIIQDDNIKPNYKIVMLYYQQDRIDTVSFEKSFKRMRVNNKTYNFDWGIFLQIIEECPENIYLQIKRDLTYRKYYIRKWYDK